MCWEVWIPVYACCVCRAAAACARAVAFHYVCAGRCGFQFMHAASAEQLLRVLGPLRFTTWLDRGSGVRRSWATLCTSQFGIEYCPCTVVPVLGVALHCHASTQYAVW